MSVSCFGTRCRYESVAIFGSAYFLLYSIAFAQGTRVGVGHEIREAQRDLTEPAPAQTLEQQTPFDNLPDLSVKSPSWWRTLLQKVSGAAPLDEELTPQQISDSISVLGDWHVLLHENLWHSFRESLVAAMPEGQAGLDRVAAEYRQELVERGYLLSAVSVNGGESSGWEVVVDAGRYGDLQLFKTVFTEDGTPIREPYQGRYFSDQQIHRMLSDFSYGKIFYYPDLYSRMYDANMHPDLTLNTKLRLRQAERRYADMEVTVLEQLPLHAILEINNFGTESTEDWRAGLTLQHLNLLKREDVLTFRGINATDFSSMNSFSLNYRLPYRGGNGGAFSVYGGYSRVDSDEIAPDIRVKGSGWFLGGLNSYRLIENARSVLNLGLGAVYRVMEDQLVFAEIDGAPREAEALPLSFSLSYGAKRNDRWLGRNYFTVETAANAGAWLELSSDEAFNNLRQDAQESYMVYRLQLARLQSLDWKSTGTVARDWSLFAKFEGQYADGALIPAEQFAVGGSISVRGYEERALLGDHGGYATLELRSPILQNALTRLPLLSRGTNGSQKKNVDRLQGLLFFDAGFITRAELLQGEERTESIFSSGIGVRWAFSRYAQFRTDVGYRFEEVLDQETGVGFHLSLQLQF